MRRELAAAIGSGIAALRGTQSLTRVVERAFGHDHNRSREAEVGSFHTKSVKHRSSLEGVHQQQQQQQHRNKQDADIRRPATKPNVAVESVIRALHSVLPW